MAPLIDQTNFEGTFKQVQIRIDHHLRWANDRAREAEKLDETEGDQHRIRDLVDAYNYHVQIAKDFDQVLAHWRELRGGAE
jgi:hypothetical protein